MISSELKTPKIPPLTRWVLALALLAPAWWWSYTHLTDFADALLVQAGLTRQTALGEAVHFFFFDTPKVLLLLTGVVFVMGVVQTFFAPSARAPCWRASVQGWATYWPHCWAS